MPKIPPRTIDTNTVRQLGIDAAADGRITAKEKSALLRDFRRLSATDRTVVRDQLRAEAPRAAAVVTPFNSPATLEEFRAQVGNDLQVGPTSKPQANSNNELRKAGIGPKTQNTFHRLSDDEKYAARRFLSDLGFSERAIKDFTTPPMPTFPSWAAFSNGYRPQE